MEKSIELKKVLSGVVLSAFLFQGSAFALQTSEDIFQSGVDAYRKGDVQECYDTMRALKKKDPTNAYIIYYLAMSNAKLGDLDEAKKNYEEVIMLNQDSELVSYAKEGIQNIENASGSKSDKKETLKAKVSRDIDRPSAAVEEVDKKASVSDDEVAKAIKTLREAGLLNVNLGVASSPTGSMPADLMQQSSELMNLNMMMGTMGGGGGKSSGMDMLPFLMMQQQQGAAGGNSKISPEVIQMMMNNAMLDSMSAFDTNNKDK